MSAPDSGLYRIEDFTSSMPPLVALTDRVDEKGNGHGTCVSCKKFRRLWSSICGWCGDGLE